MMCCPKTKDSTGTTKHKDILQALNKYLASPPLLSKPSDEEMLQLYLAFSNISVGTILTREAKNQQLPIYCVNKALLDAETRYSSLEKLVLALVIVVKKLRHYFETHAVVVMTNYPIKSVLRKPEMIGRMGKWAVALSGYDIKYL